MMMSRLLATAGYGVKTIFEIEELSVSLKKKRPYAVVVDTLLARASAQALADLRSRIPAGVPAVTFSLHADGVAGYGLLPADQNSPTPIRARLLDALRQTNKSTGKEVKTVLIIEDEAALSELLARTLVFKGFAVLQARTGHAGVELALGSLPDVIILDLTLPEGNGVEVVQKLRAQPKTHAIPGRRRAGVGPHYLHFSLSFQASADRISASSRTLNPCNSCGFGCVYLHWTAPDTDHCLLITY